MSLKIGNKAPDFESINQNGDKVKLSNFIGKKVVLYFYPRDNTPGCTAQACNLKENYNTLEKRIEVLDLDETPAYGLETKVQLGINGVVECK